MKTWEKKEEKKPTITLIQ